MRLWYLEVSTWKTMLGYARHYYGRLVCPSVTTYAGIEVEHEMSAAEAARLSEKDDYEYQPGDVTSQFESEDLLIAEAVRAWRVRAGEDDALIRGSAASAQPQPALAGPESFVQEMNALVAECESVGWWEGDERAMSEILVRYDALVGRGRGE